ncbi:hypothetical protein J7J23_02825 [bacterium]|nr:hypothetical protein [bacterium]
MKSDSIIRTVYLYLFALLGLVLITIGLVKLIDLGLKNFIFKKADQPTYKLAPPLPVIGQNGAIGPSDFEKIAKSCSSSTSLSKEQQKFLVEWISDYKEWKEGNLSSEEIKSIKNQSTASFAFSLIIVGLPLYLYHWAIIKREIKEAKENGRKDEKIKLV